MVKHYERVHVRDRGSVSYGEGSEIKFCEQHFKRPNNRLAYVDWLKMTSDEKRFIKMVLAFFAFSDCVSIENSVSSELLGLLLAPSRDNLLR